MSWSHPVRRSLLAGLPLLAVLAFRLAGPLSLDANDQAKQALYALDIRQNGNWILPQERGSVFATKPPLYAWLAAGSTAVLGIDPELACRVPSVLAFLAVAWLLFRLGTERWRPEVGALAVAAFATSHLAIALAVQIRPDMVMTALLLAALFALHRAERGRADGMAALFWGSVSLSALTKGPVAPLIAAAGIALAWCTTPPLRAPLRSVLCSRSVALLAVPLLWLGLAVLVGESTWIRETVLPELVDRALASGSRAGRSAVPGTLVAQLVAKSAPWSVFALIALARSWRRGSAAAPERLVASFLVGGVAILGLSRGVRQDYALPFVPLVGLLAAAALLEIAPDRCGAALWRRGAAISGAAFALLALGSLGGVLPAVPIGTPWTGVALLAAVLLLVSAAGGRGSLQLGMREAAAGVGALLCLHALYNGELSPVARSEREPELRAFAGRVATLATPQDRIELIEGVPRSVFFRLGRNRPAVAIDDLGAFTPWKPRGGRLLFVLREEEARALDARWPQRFRRLSEGYLVLVEDRFAT